MCCLEVHHARGLAIGGVCSREVLWSHESICMPSPACLRYQPCRSQADAERDAALRWEEAWSSVQRETATERQDSDWPAPEGTHWQGYEWYFSIFQGFLFCLSCLFTIRSRPGKPNQRKRQNEKFMNFAHFCEFWCFFPHRKTSTIHIELLFRNAPVKSSWTDLLWFGLPGPLLIQGETIHLARWIVTTFHCARKGARQKGIGERVCTTFHCAGKGARQKGIGKRATKQRPQPRKRLPRPWRP